ncbi:MAG: hypothetical protein U1U88_000171 [Lawsonella clevelandensis]
MHHHAQTQRHGEDVIDHKPSCYASCSPVAQVVFDDLVVASPTWVDADNGLLAHLPRGEGGTRWPIQHLAPT